MKDEGGSSARIRDGVAIELSDRPKNICINFFGMGWRVIGRTDGRTDGRTEVLTDLMVGEELGN